MEEHLSLVAKAKRPAMLRGLIPLSKIEGMAVMSGGTPHPSLFPVKSYTLELVDGERITIDDPTLVAPAPTGASNKLVVGLDELRPSPETPRAEAAPESSPIESAAVPASPAPGPAPAAEDPPGDLPSVFSRLGKSKKIED